jgi:hypothetical protein
MISPILKSDNFLSEIAFESDSAANPARLIPARAKSDAIDVFMTEFRAANERTLTARPPMKSQNLSVASVGSLPRDRGSGGHSACYFDADA